MDKYAFFTSKEIKPAGWLRRQLELQAEGLCGNLDKVWPDIRDSAWIGGDREGWERVPYWLDGFIPLAYLLENEDMKARAKKYIDKILENQQEDGWICPNGNVPRDKYDTWAICLISKVLVVYYECSHDERIPMALYRLLKNYYELLSDGRIELFAWGKFRWFECFVAIRFIKKLYPDEAWINALAKIMKEQGADWESFVPTWKDPKNTWTFHTHIVNIGMMLKYEAISADLIGEAYRDIAGKLYNELKKYNGNVTGFFTGDECLSGISPIQGTELCAVVEMMYSCEWLYACTGENKWAELLELQAFNALPATITDDMWAHQYVQLSNQIDCTPYGGNAHFGTNGREAHLFGLEPNFGCCTANFGQGWPKLALAAFMRSDDGAVNVVPVASELSFVHKGAHLTVSLETDYPFAHSFVYRVTSDKKTSAKLRVRIPSYAKNISVNGELVQKRGQIVFSGFPEGETVINLSYEVETSLTKTPVGLYSARYGSLIFALPIDYEERRIEYVKANVERKYPYCDYHFVGKGNWNYGFADDELKVVRSEGDGIPFSSKSPSIKLVANMCPIDWGMEYHLDNVCARKPHDTTPKGDARAVELYPYGAAKLRMTEMPKVKLK